jgi:hypothetical protein
MASKARAQATDANIEALPPNMVGNMIAAISFPFDDLFALDPLTPTEKA